MTVNETNVSASEMRTQASMTKWSRRGGIAATLAGVLYILSAPIAALYPVAVSNNAGLAGFASQALTAAAMLFVVGGLVGLHIRQRDHYGWLGTIGFVAAAAGAILTPPQIAYILVTGSDPPIWILGGGVIAIFVGTVLLGIATVRAGVLPRWCGVVLVVFFPSIFVGGLLPGLGTFLPGLIWLALGYALWTESSGNDRVGVVDESEAEAG